MKTYVLNLPKRNDRRELFDKTNKDILTYEYFDDIVDGKEINYNQLQSMGFDTYKDWIDPIENTRITKGEVGCFLSHWRLWEKCIELNEPILILEDDAVCTDRFNIKEVEELLNEYNLIYLGWKEMGNSTPIDSKYVIPEYPYWGLAYVITPESATKLIENDIKHNIIPVDEYLPKRVKDLRCIGYKENVIYPRDRSETGSDIYKSNRYDYFIDFDVYPITVGTDKDKCIKLFESAKKYGTEFTNLGDNIEWTGGDMNFTGGGQKLNLLKEVIDDLPEHDVIFFCDAYDVFLCDTIEEMCYRYLEIGHKVLFAAEKVCWPNENLADQSVALNKKQERYFDTPYQYLNSGVFMGRVSELKKILEVESIKDNESDQLWMQYKWLSELHDIALDTDCYIFQCHEPECYKDGTMLYNPITKCYNCLYHGNGGSSSSDKLNELYESFLGPKSPIIHIPIHDYEILDNDIILVDYLTPSMCDSLIELSERHGDYKNLKDDDFPGQELRLKEMGENIWESTHYHWMENLAVPIIRKHWAQCKVYGVRDAFIIKYNMEGQRVLDLHSDASLVTGSVKLNDDYTGGELYFPRQNFSNKDIPVGKCILFPGQVTHPHTSKELKSGTKYSLTIWTQRYQGD